MMQDKRPGRPRTTFRIAQDKRLCEYRTNFLYSWARDPFRMRSSESNADRGSQGKGD